MIHIDTNPSVEKNSIRKLNEAFWLGALVTEQLAEGNSPKYSEELARFKRIWRVGAFTAIAAIAISAYYGSYGLLDLITRDSPVSHVMSMIPENLLTVSCGLALKRKDEKMTTISYIEKKKLDKAKFLAKRYPALDYAYTDTL